MPKLRALMMQHRALAVLVIVAALVLKVIVPTGFMLATGDARTITVMLCNDASGGAASVQLSIPLTKADHEAPGKPAKGECPYAALSMASLGGADAVLLALALAFIVALGFAPLRFALLCRSRFILPPQRGPPVLI